MNHRLELDCLEVNENQLSNIGKQKLLEIAAVAKVLQVNPQDPNVELALIEKLLSENELKKEFNKEVKNLSIVQSVVKDSLLLLCSLEQISPISQYCEAENLDSIEKEIKDLQHEFDSFVNNNYSEAIDHEHLVELSQEIEKLTQELDKLQEKNELYGDFPTNPHKAQQVVLEAESEMERLEEEWTKKCNNNMECLLESSHSQIYLGPIRYKLKIYFLSGFAMLAYGALIVLTLCTIIWLIFQDNKGEYIVFAELGICALTVIDLILRCYLIGFCLYIKNLINIFEVLLSFGASAYALLALFEGFFEFYLSFITLALLGVKNSFDLVKLIVLHKKLNCKRTSEFHKKNANETKLLENILEGNRKELKQAFRPRLDTLGEEEEILEDSSNQRQSVWKGRVKKDSMKDEIW